MDIEGGENFAVRAIDAAGNRDPTRRSSTCRPGLDFGYCCVPTVPTFAGARAEV